jgi:hypothetical protein
MFTFAEEVIIKNADQFGTQSNRGGWQLTLMQKAIEKAGFGRFLPRERGALASIIARSLAAEIKRTLETQFDD